MISKENIEQLGEIKTQFAKYCHAEECEEYEDCPESHPDCSKNLDLDTAIAWRVFMRLDYLHCVSKEQYISDQELMDDIHKVETYISDMHFTISFHTEKYQKLSDLLLKTRMFMFYEL